MQRKNNISTLLHTIVYLKPIQIWYQLYYRLRTKVWKFKPVKRIPDRIKLNWEDGLYNVNTHQKSGTFRFLNISHQFTDEINWNIPDYGKLWAYNLNYFDYLNQKELSTSAGLQLIQDFITQSGMHKVAYEPYPTSLRIINWVKFLSKEQLNDQSIDLHLYNDCLRLTGSLEYHILANHLLENGFGMLFGAFYFQDEHFYQVAMKIITEQLPEQIISDGGHFELSPMYHQIILYRILDSLNLIMKNPWKQDLLSLLDSKAGMMLSWLRNITFQNGEVPRVNDTAIGITPGTDELFMYAQNLKIKEKNVPLNESGYRKFENEQFELFIDVGQIAPSYQPGHSHADNLQFLLNYKNQPIIVDTGISTYEKSDRRQSERSTLAHNTLTINEKDSSEVWGGFRVGRRARTRIILEEDKLVVANHDGYRKEGIIHQRSFNFSEKVIKIVDTVSGDLSNKKIKGYLHFNHNCTLKIEGSNILVNNELQIHIENPSELFQEEYELALGYNKIVHARRVCYIIDQSPIKISIKQKIL